MFLAVAVAALALCQGGGASSVRAGAALYAQNCLSCHGLDGAGVPASVLPLGAGGIKGAGPPLRGVGAAAADFYLTTGYMPLEHATDQPRRKHSPFTDDQIRSLVAYIASLGPGLAIPSVEPARGDVALGRRAFTESCAGCHQSAGAGGLVVGAVAPSLYHATPVQIAEAVRIGPGLMPRFEPRQIDEHTLASIALYVGTLRDPDDPGGWALGHLGPISEGAVAWLLGGTLLVAAAVALGRRA
jgi:ubiquinol-cytochrome c reductase cytochrome c subunit